MRCYNGAWDSEATALFAEQDRLLAKLRKREPSAHCTYFPMEGKYQVYAQGRPLGGFYDSKLAALRSAVYPKMGFS